MSGRGRGRGRGRGGGPGPRSAGADAVAATMSDLRSAGGVGALSFKQERPDPLFPTATMKRFEPYELDKKRYVHVDVFFTQCAADVAASPFQLDRKPSGDATGAATVEYIGLAGSKRHRATSNARVLSHVEDTLCTAIYPRELAQRAASRKRKRARRTVEKELKSLAEAVTRAEDGEGDEEEDSEAPLEEEEEEDEDDEDDRNDYTAMQMLDDVEDDFNDTRDDDGGGREAEY